MSDNNVYRMLLSLPCHFTWEQLQIRNIGRTVEMNIENLEEHIEQTIQGTEVESYNLMGFYKTQDKSFIQAREYFNMALEKTNTDDEKIVGLACLAWLTWKEESSDSSFEDQIRKVQRILRGREAKDIPEVMAEKAFSIANSGFTESGFQEALVCTNRALEINPDDVMSKYTKVLVMQQSHQVRKKNADQHDTTVNEIKQLWEEIIETLKDRPDLHVSYGQALIQFASFLSKTKMDDNGASEEYAEKAKEVASSNHAVMRNVAKFYIFKTTHVQRHLVSKLEDAEVILNEIVGSKQGKAVYKERSLLGQLLRKKYRIKPDETTFVEAEYNLRESWNGNRKYITLALDLCQLYQEKYRKDTTEDISVLVKAEKILFQELFSYSGELDETNKAHFYTTYANFLYMYGGRLASYHQTTSNLNNRRNRGIMQDKLEHVFELLKQYTNDRDDSKLLRAEQKFREMYGNLEQLKGSCKARFHAEYGLFLKNYSHDLAFWYLLESLKCNPYQRSEYTYKKLEKLAKEKIARSDREEQRKGHEALEKMKELQQLI